MRRVERMDMQRHQRADRPFANPRAVALLAGVSLVLSACGGQQAPAKVVTAADPQPDTLAASKYRGVAGLGPNVKIFDPSMPVGEIQATVDAIAREQVPNQFGTQRYALLFKPGTYGSAAQPLIINVGYYTEVAGLGRSPNDVTINGHVDVYNQCFPNKPDGSTDCTALDNFWRSLSNLTVNVTGGVDGCRASANFWAVSQAAPMRRVNIVGGNLTLQDYCTAGPQYASGGFIANSKTGFIINGSQQQFLVRNSNIGGWSNGVWNQVFAGVEGAPAQSFPNPPYTTLAQNPASREKPYLYVDDKGQYNVFVPNAQTNSSGTTWQNAQESGRSVPLRDFFVVKPTDSAIAINLQLARGKNLLFTPGVYDINLPIFIWRPDTVVLGLGVATLTAQNGTIPMVVADRAGGVSISGLMFDAGPTNSPVLLQLGLPRNWGFYGWGGHWGGDAGNPTALHDVFFRIGGPHVGKATTSLEVNSDNTILDDIWAWRADHGTGVGWTVNTADHGVIVNGDDVTATGLFVEHYQKNEVVWNGERGKTIMFQNEMPYDPPNQAAWQHDGILGYAGYKVADTVRTHEGWGLGSYIFTNVDPSIHASHGFEVPVTPGVRMHDLLTVELSAGTIDHVINDTGAPVTSAAIGVPSDVVSYP